MFDFVRNNNRLLQGLLLILIVPSFVLFGIEGYSRFTDGSSAAVASVAGQKITKAEWEQAHRMQSERLRNQTPQIDPKLLDSPEAKYQALEQLVNERTLNAVLERQHLYVSQERLNKVFWTDPAYAMLRTADGKVNEQVLRSQGMSFAMFEQRLRQDLSVQQVIKGVAESVVAPAGLANSAFDAYLQQREVRVQRFAAADFAAQVQVSDADLEAYYKDPKHANEFQLPESADVEVLQLDLEALKKGVQVQDKDLRDYYEQNRQRYGAPEERRASHILIKVGEKDDKAKLKARAEALLAELRQKPDTFADVARKQSQDEGSASNGGDLDFFSRGAMTPAFEKAAFALKAGELSDIVETEFGFHIIKLTGVRGGDVRPFEAVRAEIEDEYRKQQAQKRYSELAEQFSNLVYEQSDSLKPAADKLGLAITRASLQRKAMPGAPGLQGNAKALEAIFSTDSVQNKRNSEAVEVGPSQLVSARVVEHRPARRQALADVKEIVRQLVTLRKAGELAVKAGEERLAALKSTGTLDGLADAVLVSRAQPGKLSRKALEQLMRTEAGKLPAFTGLKTEDGSYLVMALTQVKPREGQFADPKLSAQQYANAWASAETEAYFKALKSENKVQIKAPKPAASSPSL